MNSARILATGLVAAVIAAACGGAAAPAPSATPAPASATAAAAATRSASPAPTAAPTTAAPATATPAPAAAGAITWTFAADRTKASVRVREQLARLPAPSDAVLATALTGSFTLNADGTFAATSKATADLTALKSDQEQRDNFVKRTTLETAKFPSAVLVPTKATGLALPLAASGDLTFKLTGKLTIHGVEKEVTFDVKAKRAGTELTGTATLAPSLKFGDFGMAPPAAPVVLSVIDEIRMDVEFAATETK